MVSAGRQEILQKKSRLNFKRDASKYMKFIVDSSPSDYTWIHGGIIVLHKLAKVLADVGHEVYIVTPSSKKTLPDSKCHVISREEAQQLCSKHDVVAIYPEIIVGNPYGAKYVVRWLLYYPGGHNGPSVFDESEYVFAYQSIFVENSIYKNSPSLVILETNVNNFYSTDTPRTYDAVLIRKGRLNSQQEYNDRHVKYYEPYANLVTNHLLIFDHMINDDVSYPELNKHLNTIKYFVTCDHATYHSVLASLAGCISVVIPVEGLSKEQWKKQLPNLTNGVAYGFDDIDWAIQTRDALRNRLNEIENENTVQVLNFINLVKQRFCLQ